MCINRQKTVWLLKNSTLFAHARSFYFVLTQTLNYTFKNYNKFLTQVNNAMFQMDSNEQTEFIIGSMNGPTVNNEPNEKQNIRCLMSLSKWRYSTEFIFWSLVEFYISPFLVLIKSQSLNLSNQFFFYLHNWNIIG